ncbi:VOC family protein (plasmid) [Streptomyces sp. CWNU-52B]|uniref:VOC family protein n=1 Tax=unclassified Streptomyces TaxID=2593676 RepID=UPI0039C08DB4
MALEWEQVIVHSVDPAALGQWWAEALGWVVVHSTDDEFEIRPAPDRLPGLDFVRIEENKNKNESDKAETKKAKQAKSRLHLDFRPDDQAAEVARLEAHGAQRVDIGQGDQSWIVMADPEGNEFCVLGQRRQ